MGFETLVLGNAWFSWETGEWIILFFQDDDITVSMDLSGLVLFLVSSSVDWIQCSSERIWGNCLEFILVWKSSIHSVLLEEPLESVDAFINVVLERFVFFIIEFLHLLLHLGCLLDEFLLLFLDFIIANLSFCDDVLLEIVHGFLEVHGPPFSDNDEVVKELVLAVVEFVICLFFVAIEDLDQRCGKVPVLNLVNGLDGVVVKGSHDVSVLMELLEDLVFVVIKFAASVFVFLEKECLQLL